MSGDYIPEKCTVGDGSAISSVEILISLCEQSVEFRTQLGQFFEDDPVLFEFEINSAAAIHAGDSVATVKPNEKLDTFVAAFLAANPNCQPTSGF